MKQGLQDGSVTPLAAQIAIFRTRLKSFAREMVVGIQRTARSPLKNQAYDFGVVIMDAQGGLLEADEFRALFPFAIHPGCRDVIATFADEIFPGDVFMHNDVFGGNLQPNDTGVYVPIFVGEELIAWTGAKGHMADLGGPVPSSCNPEATDYFQESLRIPAVKIVERGKLRRDVWNLIFANVRLPDIDSPDMMTMIGACRLGERRIRELAETMGVGAFRQLVNALYDATQAMMRAEIASIPNGTYLGESQFYFDGIRDSEQSIRLRLSIKDGEMELDYTGTSPQSQSYCNAPLGSATAGTLTFLSMLVDPLLPHNEGMLRPLRLIMPEGTILNPRPPAATYYGNFMSAMNAEAIMRAFSQAVPERVTAGWTRPMSLQITAWDPRRARWYGDIDFISLKGGSGATHGLDGWNNGPIFGVSTLTNDYEFFELQDPHTLLEHEFKRDSSGSGKWRGGNGTVTRWRFEGESVTLVLQGEPEGGFGLFGGLCGTDNIFTLRFPDGSSYRPRPKEVIRMPIPAGTIIERHSGGGGGFGDPMERPVEKVAEDIQSQLISPQKARDDYGVVADRSTLVVDAEHTRELRARRLADQAPR
jgi:N-methylhydantoinase B